MKTTLYAIVLICILAFNAEASGPKDCSSTKIKDSKILKSLLMFLEKDTGSKSVIIRSAIADGNYYIVEYESSDFEPGIDLLLKQNKGYTKKCGWGGIITPDEGNPKDVIIDYFRQKVPNVSEKLLRCYNPVGPPFNPQQE